MPPYAISRRWRIAKWSRFHDVSRLLASSLRHFQRCAVERGNDLGGFEGLHVLLLGPLLEGARTVRSSLRNDWRSVHWRNWERNGSRRPHRPSAVREQIGDLALFDRLVTI